MLDETCRASIAAVERLQGMVAQGYKIRMEEVDRRIFIFAHHFTRGNKAGQGRSLIEAVENLYSNEENL
jgi:hypothetical protein